MKILFLLPSLDYSGAARQALLLGRGLANGYAVRICVLREVGPWAAPLRAAGVTVDNLGWTRPLDPRPLWRLRHLLRAYQPDCIHVWRPPALRTLALVGRRWLARTLVSHVCPVQVRKPHLGRFDRYLLGRVRRVVAGGTSEAQRLRSLGVPEEKLAVVPPGVDLTGFSALSEPSGKSVVCLGKLESYGALSIPLRAADYLTYAFRDFQLHILCAGAAHPFLERGRAGVNHVSQMHFLGQRDDAAAWLAGAQVCWVPSSTMSGRQVALEAMAAALPVIASDLPHLRELITDGVDGMLVPPGSEIAIAQRTRQLLLDGKLRHRIGAAARAKVHSAFSSAAFIENWRRLYAL